MPSEVSDGIFFKKQSAKSNTAKRQCNTSKQQ
ncbi:hypothetical protein M703_01345 [Neisseria gonorrhoeae SK29344]|uniref:Uncharacterized protein n=1 Tax=Neisseria gonorrhoeae 3502 TaxID=1193404 RepID=A0AA44ZHP0_NEIGO|nr:hypothetical protein T556_11175 [Neisseria gonorrhoeae NG-k51.05]KLR90725.1 hypothetical protein M677_05465 [Neisseria gonorrhoeae SK6987]KLR95034.1 hypothetical protein M685_08775 [Neisseria gonorrhoeae SK16259]KLS08770.1 hypothetical protein M716_04335 [Neisseria gonorrhoeae SK32402]KLS09757.1 hypothetical protein M703_01345 [Neisseria gonorrhoeae SK29344]KLS23926.1 hypothetical protein M733_07285 [Neisseria gonorrhoeae ATL_2011_05-13]KLS37813.1 hypothetical protein M724_03025 [Neisseria